MNTFNPEDTEAGRKRIKNKALNCVAKSLKSLEYVRDQWTNITGVGHQNYAMAAETKERREALYDAKIAAGKKSGEDKDWRPSPLQTSPLRKKKSPILKRRIKKARSACMRSPPLKIPPPTNGVEYQPESALKHIIENGSEAQGAIIDYMVGEELVPVSKHHIPGKTLSTEGTQETKLSKTMGICRAPSVCHDK